MSMSISGLGSSFWEEISCSFGRLDNMFCEEVLNSSDEDVLEKEQGNNDNIIDNDETLLYSVIKSEEDPGEVKLSCHGLKFMNSGTVAEVDLQEEITKDTSKPIRGSNPELEKKRRHICSFPIL